MLDHPAGVKQPENAPGFRHERGGWRKGEGVSATTDDRHGGATKLHKQRGGDLPPDVTPEEDGLLGIVRIAEMRHSAGEGRAGASRQGSALIRRFPLPRVESNAFHNRTAIWPRGGPSRTPAVGLTRCPSAKSRKASEKTAQANKSASAVG